MSMIPVKGLTISISPGRLCNLFIDRFGLVLVLAALNLDPGDLGDPWEGS
jgi:hypothetical protein